MLSLARSALHRLRPRPARRAFGPSFHNESTPRDMDPELKLPKMASLMLIIIANAMMQITFFIVISSSNEYAKHLGGNSTFSGIVIGIPPVFSGLIIIPLMKWDRGGYKIPLHVCCACSIVGLVLYSLAYRANYLYLILLGRIVNGFGFSMFLYCKRYCSDPRIVGIRRRTTLASWLVMGQGIGMSLGPFAGGLFHKVGFSNTVFNGYTSPSWVLAGGWCLYWAAVALWYEDPVDTEPTESEIELPEIPVAGTPTEKIEKDTSMSTGMRHINRSGSSSTKTSVSDPVQKSRILSTMRELSREQWGVLVCMCWFAMLCFFVLGAWEANLPVFGAVHPPFHWSPFSAGNFIALGGITAFPFLILNILFARRVQDRYTLAFGTGLGQIALIIFLALLKTNKLVYASAFVCWWAVATGFNLTTTVTLSLLSKRMPASYNNWTSMAIQYSMFIGRVSGAVWGGSGVGVGMPNYVALEIVFVGIGILLCMWSWKDLKAKTG